MTYDNHQQLTNAIIFLISVTRQSEQTWSHSFTCEIQLLYTSFKSNDFRKRSVKEAKLKFDSNSPSLMVQRPLICLGFTWTNRKDKNKQDISENTQDKMLHIYSEDIKSCRS